MTDHEESARDVLLARIDERVAHLGQDIKGVRDEFSRMESALDSTFVRISRYIHVERAVVGVIALVITLLVAFVFSKVVGHS